MPLLRHIFTPAVCFYAATCFAQKSDSTAVKPKLQIGGYVDAYVAYYTDSVGPGKFQKFPATSPQSSTFGLNIIQITEQFTSDRIRSTATLQYGALPTAAWSPIYNNIQEANVGVRPAKNLWIDAGFFKTHIGTEALLPKDNMTSSCSIITFYEPWWQSGVRLVYTPNDKFSGALYVVNGYNQFTAANKKKSLGLAITYTFSDNFNIAYNNLLSDDTHDSVPTPHWRFLNNVVFNLQLGKNVKMLLGVDLISQQNSSVPDTGHFSGDYASSRLTGGTAFIYSGIFTVRYALASKFAVYARAEYFKDHNGFLTGLAGTDVNGNNIGYQIAGQTLGFEYKPTDNSFIRLEGRELEMLKCGNAFYFEGKYTADRTEVMLNMGIWF